MIASVTLKPLVWHPHIAPVELPDATPEQLEAMKVTPSAKKVSAYVRTLAHDPESYVARTVLFNAIMYAEGGLPRPDRELGALGASVVNGCAYCAVIHGRQHAHLTQSTSLVSAVYLRRLDLLSPRDAAIFAFARRLSVTPSEATTEDIVALRAVGLDDAEILDLIHAIAIFGWANRLMHVLGHAEPQKPAAQPRRTP
ncbi:peroxidase-related enzyme [Frigidibacter albus]|uniref:Peroxidase-related enzyme n=1 Tax=Frigidibacter albus TaxID=1465486 RepID=A0A6L8VHI1_9RHOB|nr:peroxidase-related enzyme [Frigidibacter albus]MZQ89191.1 peroxidase-related enzyme [Frigidibacter albus]NBE30752.1 peroxidase-related enzyme [Frigidibacter albus]GGH50852.1 alkyl hydroperoxide reductase AhpD [Frigidibacter albus]